MAEKSFYSVYKPFKSAYCPTYPHYLAPAFAQIVDSG